MAKGPFYTTTYKSRLTQKKRYKKTDAIFSIYGKNGIIPWHFLNSHCGLSRSLRSNDLGWLNFEVVTSKVWHCFSKFGSSPQKGKVDLCTTNGSKVLIYLTLQYFKFYCTHVSNAKGNIAKSNKSELWNHLSYRGLPYLFDVGSQTFRNNSEISRS